GGAIENGPSGDLWTFRRIGDAGELRPREAQSLVYPGLRGLLRYGIGIRFPTGRLAIWTGGNGVVDCGAAALAGCENYVCMTGLHPGDQLDHYRIEELVARSGMASIYRATDMRTGRQVAIKIPHPDMEADPALFDRFKREGEIGEKLDHPGVMKVFADENRSRIYMVMEWLDGR